MTFAFGFQDERWHGGYGRQLDQGEDVKAPDLIPESSPPIAIELSINTSAAPVTINATEKDGILSKHR